MVGRLDSQLGSTVSALRSLATETIVFAGLVRDASNRISSMLPQSGGGMFGLAGGIFSGGNTTSALSLLAGGPSLAERRAQAQAMLASSSGPSGAMTFAAQPARHLGIEEVGLEARQKAFSMGADMQERQLAANQSTADNTAAIARLLNMTIPQLMARIAAQQIADNRG
jgi:hypothetical protein